MSQEALIDDAGLVELSLAEWLDLPKEQPGELVDGRLEGEEVPDFVHEALVALLAHLFGGWAFPRGGMVGGSEVKLVLGEKRGRKPDLVIYLPGTELPPPGEDPSGWRRTSWSKSFPRNLETPAVTESTSSATTLPSASASTGS